MTTRELKRWVDTFEKSPTERTKNSLEGFIGKTSRMFDEDTYEIRMALHYMYGTPAPKHNNLSKV